MREKPGGQSRGRKVEELGRDGTRETRGGGGGRREPGESSDICLAFVRCQAVCFHINYFIKSSQRLHQLEGV